MKYGYFDLGLRKFARSLTVLPALLFFASAGSAAPLCINGDTLAQYIGVGSCYVNAGITGLDVLFTFDSASFQYTTDATSSPVTDLTAANFTVTRFAVPGSPQAGLVFHSSSFITPTDGTVSDVNLTFGVSLYRQPSGFRYQFSSAHLDVVDTLTTADPDSNVIAVGSEIFGAYQLQQIDPADPGDVLNVTYPLQDTVTPNVNISVSNAQVTQWTESFDLTNVPEPGTLAMIPGAVLLIGLLRSRRYAKSVLPLLAVLVLFAAKSHASALCTNLSAINGSATSATSLGLDKYMAYSTLNGGCLMNDMLFDFKSFTLAPGSTGTTLASVSNTKLVFTLNASNAANLVTIQYFPLATSTASQSQAFSFQYTVTAPLYKVTKMLGSTSATLNNVTRTTTITPGATPAPDVALSPNITIGNSLNTTMTVTEAIAFSSGSGLKHISNLTETYTETVPEPLTSLLMGSALLGIGLLSKKLRRA